MSSGSSIELALDKVAQLAGSSSEDDRALKVLLDLVGGLDPPPQAAELEPAARAVELAARGALRSECWRGGLKTWVRRCL